MAAATPAEKKRKGDGAQTLLPAHVQARGRFTTLPARRVVPSASDPSNLSHVFLEFDEEASELE
jgi:hypothetical protein